MVASAARKARRNAELAADSAPAPPPAADPIVKKEKVKEPKKRKEAAASSEKPMKKVKAAPEEPPAATAWDGNAWDGNDEDDEKADAADPPAKRPGKEKISCTVFVGQLPYSASAADVKKHFKQGGVQGNVQVRLLTRRDGGGSRGLAFVELANESDVHTALRLHHSPMDGRRINIERTVGGGGGKQESARKAKISDLRERQGAQMTKQVNDMIESILPSAEEAEGAVTGGGADDGDGEQAGGGGGWGTTPAVHRGDVDERVLEFLGTVPTDMAEGALREAKALGMGGIRNRPAYLMGVLKRKVGEADKLRVDKEKTRTDKWKRKQNAGEAAGEDGRRL